MTFNQEFLRELQKRLANSDSYPMTKKQVQILTKMQLWKTDKNVIFDAISNDVHRNKDPLSLRKLWNERIKDSNCALKLRFD
jgi:phosphatidate phosphatase PAH1